MVDHTAGDCKLGTLGTVHYKLHSAVQCTVHTRQDNLKIACCSALPRKSWHVQQHCFAVYWAAFGLFLCSVPVVLGTWYWQFCAAMLRIKGDVCVTTLVHLYKGLLSSIQCCCGLWYLLLAKYYWVLDTYSSMQRCCGLWDISTTLVLWYLQFYAAVLRNLALILLRYLVLAKYYWVLAVLCSGVADCGFDTTVVLGTCQILLSTCSPVQRCCGLWL